ncbi:N-acetylglucosamine kinase [Planobispora longispora]|uniref:N-acetylglucosamine kinase n=1 Tax=Planobispora longispora TaxID=28887 RepID=A0A8J3RT71_9ACTN|nr:BadF/BadG/BcrA/BcrD ATPase family protein [Planobispora longispora]GIH80275.1 N-acetylglucosamine kinase [Planobispora longispora]
MTTLVIGVDGGGTSTRCVVATESGEIAGRGYGAGANILTAADPGESLRTALLAATEGLSPGAVAAGVFALAGSESARERAGRLAAEAWRACGLAGRIEIVPDPLAAFAGATEEPSGTVLIAGTGAVAARITGRRLARRADGHGWLLGDAGSGVWIGRRAVQAVLAFLDGRAGPTVLLDALSGHVTAWEESDHEAPADETPADHETPAGHRAATDRRAVAMTTQRAVRAVHGGIARTGPAWLGRLAPAVETAAAEGDAAALEILREAADRLVSTTLSLGPGPGPLVLAGSLLTEPTLLAAQVRAGLGGLGGTVLTARDSAAGAAALALHMVASDALPAHRELIA